MRAPNRRLTAGPAPIQRTGRATKGWEEFPIIFPIGIILFAVASGLGLAARRADATRAAGPVSAMDGGMGNQKPGTA
jgi:hypothetical protein